MAASWQPGAWGCGAMVALAAAVLASQSDGGARRLQEAFAAVKPAPPAIAATADTATGSQSETQRLAERLRALTSERDRLDARVAALERSLATTAPPQAAPAPRNAEAERETSRLADDMRALTAERDRLLSRIASLENSVAPVTGSIRTTPLPRQRETAPASKTVSDQPAAGVKFGVDLGGAPNLAMLRAQWAVAQTNYGQLFEGLRPLAGISESKPGVPELRLIVGPLNDVAAAAKLCAALNVMHAPCRTAVFDGQKLALNDMAVKHTAVEHVAVEGAPAPVAATACANPNALGTSRVLEVNADEFARIGTMQYSQTLPLADHEVVLTFDDGPLPPYTDHVLAALAAECVKATYFMVGSMANAYPDAVRRVYNGGHTIGTHSQHHPYTFASMSPDSAEREVSDGFASVSAALGDPKAVAPFFRFPGLLRVASVEKYLSAHAIMTWSADLDADDWRKIGAAEVLHRALSRLQARGRGVLLLHDIQPATALMLPALLKELKAHGYRVVQVVPGGVTRPPTLPIASSAPHEPVMQGWPRVAKVRADGEIKPQ